MPKEHPHSCHPTLILLLEVWKTHLGTTSQIPIAPCTQLISCSCDPLPTSLNLRGMMSRKEPVPQPELCLKSSPPSSDPLDRHCFPQLCGYLWSVFLQGTGQYLFVYEWTPPQLAFLPTQQHPVPSLGFPPAAGLGDLLTVQCQQPKH